MKETVNHFSLTEEIWHAVTHGIGFLLSIAALTLLVAFASLGGNVTAITDRFGITKRLMLYRLWMLFGIAKPTHKILISFPYNFV